MVLNEQIQAKWGPILEHEDLPKIEGTYKKSVTAILLENQEKMMREQAAQQVGTGLFLTEAPLGSQMGIDPNSPPGNPVGGQQSAEGPAGSAVQFVDPVLISLVRRTMPKLMAYDVCGVQPLTGPTGLIFAMRSQFGSPGQLAEPGGYYDGTAALPGDPANGGKEAFYNEANTAYSGGAGTHAPDPLDEFFTVNTPPGPDSVRGRGGSTSWGENLEMDHMRHGGESGRMNEMSFSIEKMAVTAQTRKLRGQYTLEMAQDLKATHGLNAESELANILSNEILAEINRQVIRTIYKVASIGALNTSSVGTFDLLVDSNGRWSVEKFKGLMFQLEMEANMIARLTRRGKGNVVVCSADVASALQMAGILDNATGLKNNLSSDETNNLFVGVLNGQFRVYIDPYLPVGSASVVTVGYKGTSPYDSGIFYCPYQPLQQLKAQDPATFTPIIGFMSRDAMVANPFSQLKATLESVYQPETGSTVQIPVIRPPYTPVRIVEQGLDNSSNVYYRKMKVKNLS